MFLRVLIPAHLGCLGWMAVKWSCLLPNNNNNNKLILRLFTCLIDRFIDRCVLCSSLHLWLQLRLWTVKSNAQWKTQLQFPVELSWIFCCVLDHRQLLSTGVTFNVQPIFCCGHDSPQLSTIQVHSSKLSSLKLLLSWAECSTVHWALPSWPRFDSHWDLRESLVGGIRKCLRKSPILQVGKSRPLNGWLCNIEGLVLYVHSTWKSRAWLTKMSEWSTFDHNIDL